MRTRQDGKRQQPLWVLIRDLPRETGTPVVTNKVQPPISMSDSGDNIKRVANQSIDSIAGVVGRVRSCAGRIPPLVGGHGEIPGFPERPDLGVPEEARHPKPCSMSTSGAASIPSTDTSKVMPGATSMRRVSIVGPHR
jgi:hypothetical protein